MCEKIDTRTYHEFMIDENYFMGDLIFTKGNEIRITCSDLFKRQYKNMGFFSFPCVKTHMTYIVSIY